MQPFEIYPSERVTFTDRISGATVHRLTDYKGHSTHPYFTDDGWYDGDRRMLFLSDRRNVRNIFSIELESGEISRLTDMPEDGADLSSPLAVNHQRGEVYYQQGSTVYALHLETLETRPLYTPPQGYHFGGARPTGDGKYLVAGLSEDLSSRINANLAAGYIGMEEIFRAKPDCRIVRIDAETGKTEEIWRENCWVGHVNPSPTQGNLLTFCHEGPWHLVDHRIWVLDTDTGKAVKLRERRTEGEMVGHEYWFEDGLHVGYQVHTGNSGAEQKEESFFGFQHYDGTGEVEASCGAPMPTPDHVHSVGFDYVVCDSGKSIKGYKYNGEVFEGPRIICMHDGDFFWGAHHPHPRMLRNGKAVVYNSTSTGYCNIYLAEIPEGFESLPGIDMDESLTK
ncbi:MAG: oligogalacturonate lyase family protein [Oscillospiraceae bacterium]